PALTKSIIVGKAAEGREVMKLVGDRNLQLMARPSFVAHENLNGIFGTCFGFVEIDSNIAGNAAVIGRRNGVGGIGIWGKRCRNRPNAVRNPRQKPGAEY